MLMAHCAHTTTEPVEVRSHTTGGTEIVARICVDCLDALPANWGCPDCEWVEVRRLCETVPSLLPGTPCDEHRRTA